MTQLVERDWQTLAACRSADPDLFLPLSSSGKPLGQVAEATHLFILRFSGISIRSARSFVRLGGEVTAAIAR